jgi:hypothetical protein
MKNQIGTIFLLFVNFILSAQPHSSFFCEYYNEIVYRKTNFADDNEWIRAKHFFLNTSVLKPGFRFKVWPLYQRVDFFQDFYLKGELTYDFLDKYWNKNIYSNHEKLACGARAKIEKKTDFLPDLYISTDLYAEYIVKFNSFNKDKMAIQPNMEDKNTRIGHHIWFTYIKSYFFSELYYDLSFHSTNFGNINQLNYLILDVSPNIGLHATYKPKSMTLKTGGYFSFSFLSDLFTNEWNRNPYSNNTKYSYGLRLIISNFSNSELSLNFFIEKIRAIYHKNSHPWEIADTDTKCGVILWLPLGAAKYNRTRI